MPDQYSGLTADEADRLMAFRISMIVYEELAAARSMSDEEWAETDLDHRCDSIAGAIYCAVQNRLSGAPHEPIHRRRR